MPNTHATLTSLFGDIADAIRAKDGSTGAIVADTFPTAIQNIPSGVEYVSGTATATSIATYIDIPDLANKDNFVIYYKPSTNVSSGRVLTLIVISGAVHAAIVGPAALAQVTTETVTHSGNRITLSSRNFTSGTYYYIGW